MAQAPTLANTTVELTAEAHASPPRIKLKWKPDPQATSYTVYRTNKGSSLSTGTLLVSVGNGAGGLDEYSDNAAEVGRAYEYEVQKTFRNGNFSSRGLVLAGIEAPATERRGTVVLLVDATHAAYLAPTWPSCKPT